MIIRRIAIICLFSALYSLPPKSFKVFKETTLRLINNKQYTYLEEYYRNYAVAFKEEKELYELTAYLSLQIPKIELKEKILKKCLNFHGDNPYHNILLREYGMSLYFKGDLTKAEKVFQDCQLPISTFYLGIIQFTQEKYKKAHLSLLQYLKLPSKDRGLMAKACLTLAEIYYIEKKYGISYQYILKSKISTVQRSILLYKIFNKTQEYQKREKILSYIKRVYIKTPKGKIFLDSLK